MLCMWRWGAQLKRLSLYIAITQLYHLSPAGPLPTHAYAGRAIGGTFVALSILFLYFANVRYFHAQVALTKDQFPASRGAVLLGSMSVLSVLLAMFIVIILDQRG